MYSMNQDQASSTPLVEFPLPGTTTSSPLFLTSKSSPHVSTVPELQEQESEGPLPGTSMSPPHIINLSAPSELQPELSSPGTSKSNFTLPENPEQLQEVGINEEASPFSDTHSSGNCKPKII